jgi:hypothetical protein
MARRLTLFIDVATDDRERLLDRRDEYVAALASVGVRLSMTDSGTDVYLVDGLPTVGDRVTGNVDRAHPADPDRARDIRNCHGLRITGARVDDYPIHGVCATCGEAITCMDSTAEWGHDDDLARHYPDQVVHVPPAVTMRGPADGVPYERCAGLCRWAGVWGATGKMPPGHIWQWRNEDHKSGYLAHLPGGA